MDALVGGQDDLSEEFKTKAATVFESAVNSKVKEIEHQWKQMFKQITSKILRKQKKS